MAIHDKTLKKMLFFREVLLSITVISTNPACGNASGNFTVRTCKYWVI